MKSFLSSRKFRHGSLATAVTVAVIALIVVLNMILGALGERYSLRLDMTPGKVFALSPETVAFLEGLTKDVQIHVLATEAEFTSQGIYFVQANEVFKKYAQGSPHIALSYVDTLTDPTFVTRFPELQLSAGSVVVACGDRSTSMGPAELFNIEQSYYGNEIASSRAEQALTTAVLRVTSDEKTVISVITSYGASGLEAFIPILEANNFEIAAQNIMTEEIRPDAAMVLIAAPTRDWTEDDLKKLDAFLDNGGKKGKTAVYFTHVTQPDSLPNLSAFLADWGVRAKSGAVTETDNSRYIYGSPLNPLVNYTEDVYSANVLEKGLITTVPLARPLERVAPSRDSIYTSNLLEFSSSCVVFPADAPADWDPGSAERGPFPAVVLSTDTSYSEEIVRSNVVTVASVSALDQMVLSHTSLANSEYFLDLFYELCGREDVVRLQSKSLSGGQLGLSEAQVLLFALVMVIVIPLGVLIAGGVVWLRRRHL